MCRVAGSQPPELAGRTKVIEDVSVLLHRVRNGKAAKSVLMVGLRGVGKTVLLSRLKNDAEAKGLIAVEFESPGNRNLPALIAPALRIALLKLDRISGVSDTVVKAVRALGNFISAARVKFDGMEFGFDLGKETGVADTGDLDTDLAEVLQAVGQAA